MLIFRLQISQACAEYLRVAGAQGSRWSRLLQHEREQKQRLQEVVEQLARQHDTLEKSVNARPQSMRMSFDDKFLQSSIESIHVHIHSYIHNFNLSKTVSAHFISKIFFFTHSGVFIICIHFENVWNSNIHKAT